MTPVSGGDGDFTNGESYTVVLQINASAGSLIYRFAFSDGTTDAVGDPALNQTLTVQ